MRIQDENLTPTGVRVARCLRRVWRLRNWLFVSRLEYRAALRELACWRQCALAYSSADHAERRAIKAANDLRDRASVIHAAEMRRSGGRLTATAQRASAEVAAASLILRGA